MEIGVVTVSTLHAMACCTGQPHLIGNLRAVPDALVVTDGLIVTDTVGRGCKTRLGPPQTHSLYVPGTHMYHIYVLFSNRWL